MRSRSILELGAALAALVLLTGCPLSKKKTSGDGGVLGTASALDDGGSATAKLAAVDTITFKKKDPVVGSSFTETSTMEMKLDMAAPKKSTSTMKEQITSKVDILGADGKTIIKAKVAYTEHAKAETENGKTKAEASPVAGKTYIVELKDKKLLVTDENHKKVSAKEEKVVRGDIDDVVGKVDPLLTEMPGVPMKVGDKADSLSEALRDLLSGDDKIEFAETSVKLKEIGTAGTEKVGTFDVKTKVTISGGPKIVLDVAGTMTIRESDARLVSINLTGPVTLTGSGLKADGTITASQTRTY